MKKLILLLAFTSMTFLFFSCSKENPVEPPIQFSTKGIFVINEGLYGQNNSEITYYDPSTGNVITNFYSSKNGKVLGDNANSMFIFQDKGYIAVDASNKIEVIDLKTGKSIGVLDLGTGGSPREIFILNSSRGFVTSFSKHSVIEFDPSQLKITREIPVGEYPEGIGYANNKLFIANSKLGSGNSVSVIDLSTNSVIKTINVRQNPRFVTVTNDNKVIIGCSGDFMSPTSIAGLFIIDPNSLNVVDSILLAYHPQDIALTKTNIVYYINDRGVGKINLTNKQVDTVFIAGNRINDIYGIAYSIAYDDLSERLYIGNPKNFTQNGEVQIFNKDGNFIKKFDTKINPGAIYIYR